MINKKEEKMTKKEIFTIGTLYRGDICDHFVAVFRGKLTKEKRKEIVKRFELEVNSDGDDCDEMYFVEVEIQNPESEINFVNIGLGEDMHTPPIDDDGYPIDEYGSYVRGVNRDEDENA